MVSAKVRSVFAVLGACYLALVVQTPAQAQALAITGATVIDGTGKAPVSDATVLILDGRIKAVGRSREVSIPGSAKKIDARGKYVIPGLIEGVNLVWYHPNSATLAKFDGRYDELIVEAAQVALKNGVTGGFITWKSHGPARKARDLIRAGRVPGADVFVGGNIIGFDGMYSPDSLGEPGMHVTKTFAKRINEEWEQGTGRRLLWMTDDEVRTIIRGYVEKQDLDFIKYAANAHWMQGGSLTAQFISFSPRVQKAIVEEGHRGGLTVQAHTMTVEGIDMAIEAGVDILTHGEITGPTAIPDDTIRKLLERGVAVGVLPITQRNLDARLKDTTDAFTDFQVIAKKNRRNMIKAGVTLMFGTEAWLKSAEDAAEFTSADTVEPSLHSQLGQAHFNALMALEEEGMDPMTLLKTATSNVARAYKLGDKIGGSIEAGKKADLLILDANPLEGARNYRSLRTVIKDGKIVDRDALPLAPLVTSRPH